MRHKFGVAAQVVIAAAFLSASGLRAQITAQQSGTLTVAASGAYGQTISVSDPGRSWTAATDAGNDPNTGSPWIQLSGTQGTGSGTVAYMVVENNTGSQRQANVTVSDGVNTPAVLTFTQGPYPSSFNGATLGNLTGSATYASGVATVTESAQYSAGGGFTTLVLYLGYGNWGANGCEIRYVPFWNLVYLADDAGDNPWAQSVQPAPWGGGPAISNSQCSFGPNDITVNTPGDNNVSITVNAHLAPALQSPTAFVGNIELWPQAYAVGFPYAIGAPATSPITVSTVQGPPSASDPVTVNAVPGAANEFKFIVTYTDPTGSAYLDDLVLSVNKQQSVAFPNCQIMLWRPWSGYWYGGPSADWNMWDDNGNLTGNTQNSQCRLNTGANQSTFTINSDDHSITVTYDVTFTNSFAQPGTELWAWTVTSDWSDPYPNWSAGGGPWPESGAVTEYIRMGARVIAMETSGGGTGGNGSGSSVIARPAGRKSRPVRLRIGDPAQKVAR